MNPYYLDSLSRRYASLGEDHPGAFEELRERYRQYKATSLMDLAAVASTLAIDTVDDRALDPLALKAIQDTNPNFDPNSLAGYSDEEWMGIVNSAKGKYFEYLVVDRLNKGEMVGDVVLPEGYHASLAKSMTQPGWDIEIDDGNGHLDEYLQLKATQSTAYVQEALLRYPDITILTTREVADHMPHNSMVLDSNISEKEISGAVGSQLNDAGSGFMDHFWDCFHPIVPLILIAGTQGYRVAVGKQSVTSATEVAKARAARAMSAAGIGAALKAMGGGWLAIPAALLTGWIFDRSQNIDDLIMTTRKQNALLARRSTYIQTLLSQGQ